MNRNLASNVAASGGATHGTPDPLLSDREAATVLGCGRSTIWRWSAEGTIPKPLKIGGLSRWRMSWLTAVVAQAEAERDAA